MICSDIVLLCMLFYIFFFLTNYKLLKETDNVFSLLDSLQPMQYGQTVRKFMLFRKVKVKSNINEDNPISNGIISHDSKRRAALRIKELFFFFLFHLCHMFLCLVKTTSSFTIIIPQLLMSILFDQTI